MGVLIKIQISDTMEKVCKSLGVKPEDLFLKVQDDLIGYVDNDTVNDRVLIQMYVAQVVSRMKQVDRSVIEDFLSHINSLKRQFDKYDYSYVDGKGFKSHNVIEEYCKMNQVIKNK